jgi:putative ABC transport system substrate-binding protein
MKLRKVLALAAAAVMAVAALASCGVKEDSSNDSKAGGSSEKHYKIGIVQIMEHTSLNTIRDAVIDRLAELGYVDGKNCTIDAQQAPPIYTSSNGNTFSKSIFRIMHIPYFAEDGKSFIVFL